MENGLRFGWMGDRSYWNSLVEPFSNQLRKLVAPFLLHVSFHSSFLRFDIFI